MGSALGSMRRAKIEIHSVLVGTVGLTKKCARKAVEFTLCAMAYKHRCSKWQKQLTQHAQLRHLHVYGSRLGESFGE